MSSLNETMYYKRFSIESKFFGLIVLPLSRRLWDSKVPVGRVRFPSLQQGQSTERSTFSRVH
jgi:hypothetical protein